jgi:dephospho-CoA kinase
MSLIYVTGIEGCGKTTVCKELKERGYEAYDIDDDKIAAIYNIKTNQFDYYPRNSSERTLEWRSNHQWRIKDDCIKEIARKACKNVIFLCGTADNEADYLDLFTIVFALKCDLQTILHRLESRVGRNTYGKSLIEQQAVREKYKNIDEYYKKLNAVLINSDQTISSLTNQIISKINTIKPHRSI